MAQPPIMLAPSEMRTCPKVNAGLTGLSAELRHEQGHALNEVLPGNAASSVGIELLPNLTRAHLLEGGRRIAAIECGVELILGNDARTWCGDVGEYSRHLLCGRGRSTRACRCLGRIAG